MNALKGSGVMIPTLLPMPNKEAIKPKRNAVKNSTESISWGGKAGRAQPDTKTKYWPGNSPNGWYVFTPAVFLSTEPFQVIYVGITGTSKSSTATPMNLRSTGKTHWPTHSVQYIFFFSMSSQTHAMQRPMTRKQPSWQLLAHGKQTHSQAETFIEFGIQVRGGNKQQAHPDSGSRWQVGSQCPAHDQHCPFLDLYHIWYEATMTQGVLFIIWCDSSTVVWCSKGYVQWYVQMWLLDKEDIPSDRDIPVNTKKVLSAPFMCHCMSSCQVWADYQNTIESLTTYYTGISSFHWVSLLRLSCDDIVISLYW